MPRKVSSGKVGRPILGDIFAQDNIFSSVEANANIVLSPNGTGVVETTSDIETSGQSGIRFADSDSSNYVKMQSPGTLSSNITLTLPENAGNANDVLKTNGSGVLSFGATTLAVTNRTAADNNTYYIAMSDVDSGSEDTLSVANGTRLEFVPNPGLLKVNSVAVQSSTASSSTSTGALTVAGGVGIGGQMTAVSIVETSSIALKENITPIKNALESVLQLKGVTYDRLDNQEHESGLIAEWTEEVIPELVARDNDNNVVGIKYTKLTSYLIEAIKSLKLEIDELRKSNGDT